MAKLVSENMWVLVVGGEVVDSSYEDEAAAEEAAAKERSCGRIAIVVPPGDVFYGNSWGDVEGVVRA